MFKLDTIVIGAGAAGLAAARRLHDAGQTILILEARDRIGGRAWTTDDLADFPIELGAEFIHGERAVTHDLVREAGLHTRPVSRIDNLWWSTGVQAQPLDNLDPQHRETLSRLFNVYHALQAQPDMPDRSLADYLRAHAFDDDALAAAAVLLAQTCCARLDSLSCADLIREMRVDHAGVQEARIAEGYAALFEAYSRDLPMQLNTLVTHIEWETNSVRVFTGNQRFDAQHCLITIPVSLLKRGTITFTPRLSAERQRALDAVQVEPATKLIYRFREPLWNEALTYMAHVGLAARWWTPGYGRPNAAVMCAYLTADRARQIDALDEAEALQLGLVELGKLLGVANIERHVIAMRRIAWAADPYALGGYAHIPPGAADARLRLAQPEGKTLFFAGEATAFDSNPQTVHGAIESGWRAAREILA